MRESIRSFIFLGMAKQLFSFLFYSRPKCYLCAFYVTASRRNRHIRMRL